MDHQWNAGLLETLWDSILYPLTSAPALLGRSCLEQRGSGWTPRQLCLTFLLLLKQIEHSPIRGMWVWRTRMNRRSLYPPIFNRTTTHRQAVTGGGIRGSALQSFLCSLKFICFHKTLFETQSDSKNPLPFNMCFAPNQPQSVCGLAPPWNVRPDGPWWWDNRLAAHHRLWDLARPSSGMKELAQTIKTVWKKICYSFA